MWCRLSGFVLGFAIAATAAYAEPSTASTSFNCAGARFADERLICRDAGLGRLDVDLASVYRRLLLLLPETGDARSKLYREEERFVIARRRCRANRACIEQHYRDRIMELEWRAANTEKQ